MDTIRIFSAFLLGTIGVDAQTTIDFQVSQPSEPLVVYAGEDQMYDGVNPVYLGGDPTASGVYGNYAYTWMPAEYLDDPTSANPQVTSLNGPTVFYVEVTADGALCSNSSEVFVDDLTVGVSEKVQIQLQLFPNPFTDKVRFKADVDIEYITIYDVTGNFISEVPENQLTTNSVSTALLESGMYLFTFEFRNGHQKTLKLCKMR